ncbi:cystinosin homolog [Montipora foliosa]|uniref:cystinosin homolog n=1 Tax=Montipora foliosa TaxID=591990 RepID=UPI0035F0FDA9
MLGKTFLIILADVVGWGYFFCWTVSFLPQIYENWRRKCVVGFSFDMLGYFLLSYIMYVIYNVTVFFKPELVFEKSDEDNPVKLTDVVFAVVAFVCTSFQGIQCLMYDRGSQAIHLSTVLACGGCLVTLAALVIFKYFGVGSWLLVLQYCGYVNLVVSFGTYFPQVWLNFKRKSTTGFHIGGVLLDFGGGVLSILQMVIYFVVEHSSTQLTGNVPKMALGLVTLLFNIILVWQHYISYRGNECTPDDAKPLVKKPKMAK